MDTATVHYAGTQLVATAEEGLKLINAAIEAQEEGRTRMYWLSDSQTGEFAAFSIGPGVPLMVISESIALSAPEGPSGSPQ